MGKKDLIPIVGFLKLPFAFELLLYFFVATFGYIAVETSQGWDILD
jgi:hypothetical protein